MARRSFHVVGLALALSACAHYPRLALSTKLRLEADTHLFDLGDRRAEPDDWVVRVVGKHGACSGALVSSDVVVTAQHCTTDDDDREPFAPGELRVELGGSYLPWGRVGVVAHVTCPCWSLTGARGDVAALVLEARLDGIPTRPARTLGEPLEGEDLLAMGFGDPRGAWAMPLADGTVSCVHRTGRSGSATHVMDGVLRASFLSQPGDSGGPVYSASTGEILGVVSRGTEGSANLEPDPNKPYTLAARLDTCAGVIARAQAIADGVREEEWPSVRCAPQRSSAK